MLSPFVYWAQSESNVFIKVDLKDVQVMPVYVGDVILIGVF